MKQLSIIPYSFVQGDYEKYFKLICNKDDGIELVKNGIIPENMLQTETVPLSIWAKVKLGHTERTIKTAILLNLYHEGSATTTRPELGKTNYCVGFYMFIHLAGIICKFESY